MIHGLVDPAIAALAAELVFGEAEALDRQDWDGWLAMYREDARFWVPAWMDEHRITADPDTELSFIYHVSRRELEERVARLRSRKSVTAMPVPRTLHLIGSLRPVAAAPDMLEVRSNATVHVYDVRATSLYTAILRYEHRFQREGEVWKIASKKLVLINDRMPGAVDFFTL